MEHKGSEVTLLLVDDDDVDAMAVKRSFARQRLANVIVRARDGLEAMEKLEAGEVPYPFVILLDLRMPRVSGLEFLEKLRRHSEFSDTVVFVLTTSKDDQDLIESYKLHVAGYFVKEEAGENFIDVVTTLDSYWKVVHFPHKK